MKLTFEPLGKYVRLVDERNTDLETEDVLGINIDKYFMPSVANVIGTDLGNYKLLRKGRFACNPMHVGRDGRLPVARYTEEVPAIVSPAYFMFEIIDENEIEPEYLMLCFRRPDFDRMCWFRTDASVRGGITWEDVSALTIPVPPLPEQRKIVRDYQVITDRISLLRKVNDNLEAQARAIYKSWFEDYDPFSGERPSTWFETTIGELAEDVICGKTPPTEIEEYYGGEVPFITIPDMHGSVYTVKTERTLSDKGVATQANKILPENSICVSCIATVGLVCLTAEPSQTNQQINSIICKPDISPFYVYLKMTTMTDYLKALGAGGSATLNINKTLFNAIKILYPDKQTISEFHKTVAPIFSSIRQNQLELELLMSLANLVMVSMHRSKQ
ncbi:MAG: restriction endonuclease subunit S [Lachnospiraceae bacterium]|nr:restriction endonuclease subunit S [Lachnospiraceae bacterium]